MPRPGGGDRRSGFGVLHIAGRPGDNKSALGPGPSPRESENRMPIFMDRHDMRGMRAVDVANAHSKDLEVQERHGVKYMAYWYDEGRGSGFCLVDAPDAATAEQVHREAHGQIPNAIIPVELAAVEAFLGRISDPQTAPGGAAQAVDAGLRAVMFTDIVGSTEMTARLGDAAALELVRAHDIVVRRGHCQSKFYTAS